MNFAKKMGASGVIGIALLAGHSAQAEDVFINPEWANRAWYAGAGIGQTRAAIDEPRLRNSLSANGATVSSFNSDERDQGYKLFIGKRLNPYFAVEAGYFDLGKFGFTSTTMPTGALRGEAAFKGVNLDLVGQMPLSQRFSLLGRAGMNYAKTNTHFRGDRLYAITNPDASERKLAGKVGVGLEFKFSEALALRGEMERFRVNDAVGNRGDADMFSLALVYKIGRPVTARPAPASAEPAPVPAPESAPSPAPAPATVPATAPATPTPAPAPVTVSEKVTIAAEALFDSGKWVVTRDGKAALDDMLGKLQGMTIEVMLTVGHADAIGSARSNQRLSVRRAKAVKAYIVSKGIAATSVYTEGKGESAPVASNKTAKGRAKNRRVTVEVVGTRTVTR